MPSVRKCMDGDVKAVDDKDQSGFSSMGGQWIDGANNATATRETPPIRPIADFRCSSSRQTNLYRDEIDMSYLHFADSQMGIS